MKKDMDVFLYIMLFIMGTFFGSFFTLAVYRIPLRKDITHEHSFCPNCHHKLGVFDLIPIWSYLALKGKCRYCGEKVRIRYLLLEVFSGIVFVIAYFSLHVQNIFLEINKIIYFFAFVFFYVTLVLVAGIDKEYRKINSSVLLFGGISQTMYMLYLSIIEQASMYRYNIYFIIFILLWIVLVLLERQQQHYSIEIVLLLSYIVLVVKTASMLPILIFTFVLAILSKMRKQKVPLGFMISFFTIGYKIVENIIEFWII